MRGLVATGQASGGRPSHATTLSSSLSPPIHAHTTHLVAELQQPALLAAALQQVEEGLEVLQRLRLLHP